MVTLSSLVAAEESMLASPFSVDLLLISSWRDGVDFDLEIGTSWLMLDEGVF